MVSLLKDMRKVMPLVTEGLQWPGIIGRFLKTVSKRIVGAAEILTKERVERRQDGARGERRMKRSRDS